MNGKFLIGMSKLQKMKSIFIFVAIFNFTVAREYIYIFTLEADENKKQK